MQLNHQVLFLSHGGGPMPLLNDGGHLEMVDTLKQIAVNITKPSAIVMISAHWEESMIKITSGSQPDLIYDYYGFPQESYEITYPCSGHPVLADRIHQQLKKAGIESAQDTQRGFDHGLFIPLKIMFPNADIPCVQVSLRNDLNPEAHINVGKALHALEDENLLIIGSGFSFHNMKAFFSQDSLESNRLNTEFETWLMDTMTDSNLDETQREHRLIHWEQAPGSRFCHPREEHLIPLHVCYGAAQAPCSTHYALSILNKKCSMYYWRKP